MENVGNGGVTGSVNDEKQITRRMTARPCLLVAPSLKHLSPHPTLLHTPSHLFVPPWLMHCIPHPTRVHTPSHLLVPPSLMHCLP